METHDKVAALRKLNPRLPAVEIAEKLGISRERVRQILVQLGLPTKTGAAPRARFNPPRMAGEPSTKQKAALRRFGNSTVCNVSGGAYGEMLVCADLLARGFDVYRTVSQASQCDLVIVSRKTRKMLRIEVRCGSRNKGGSINWAKKKAECCDLYAIVLHGPEICYRPDDSLLTALDTA